MQYKELNPSHRIKNTNNNNINTDKINKDNKIIKETLNNSDDIINNDINNSTIGVFILTYNNNNFKTDFAFYELEILGKKIIDYVKDSLLDHNPIFIHQEKASSIYELLLPYLNTYEYLCVFYCDTPLLSKKVVNDAIDYATLKELDVCKLARGIIFKSKYLKEQNVSPQTQDFNFYENDFKHIDNLIDLEAVTDILKDSINKRHQLNGVIIKDSKTTLIDYDCIIEPNVTIYGNNIIKNNSTIKANSIIYPNNYISQSFIGQNCSLFNNIILNTNISDNTKTEPFTIINPNNIIL